jgi:hypothetical protein
MNKICFLCANSQSPVLCPKDIEGFEKSYKVIESVYQRLLKNRQVGFTNSILVARFIDVARHIKG